MPYGLDTAESATSLPLTPSTGSTSKKKPTKDAGLIDLAASVNDGSGGPGAVFKLALLSRYAPGIANAAMEEALARDPNSGVSQERQLRSMDLAMKQQQSQYTAEDRAYFQQAGDQAIAEGDLNDNEGRLFQIALHSGDTRAASGILSDALARRQRAEEFNTTTEQRSKEFDFQKEQAHLQDLNEKARIGLAGQGLAVDRERLKLDRDQARVSFTQKLFEQGVPYDLAGAITAETLGEAAYNKPVHQMLEQTSAIRNQMRAAKTDAERMRYMNAYLKIVTDSLKKNASGLSPLSPGTFDDAKVKSLKQGLIEQFNKDFGTKLPVPGEGAAGTSTDPNATLPLPDELAGF